jgi:EAL domain-containing protein (putative c-di-GMP-specific phosphodiesterase class I)
MAWQAAGLPALPISVNVSAAPVRAARPRVAVARRARTRPGMPGHLLELEITENGDARATRTA